MSKLSTQQECLDVEDTARHLTGSFNEAVTAKDVLNMVMEGTIRISVRFKFPVTVRSVKITEGVPTGRWGIDFLYAGKEEEKYLTLDGDRRCLEGVVDLALIGSCTRNLVTSPAWRGTLDEEIAADDLLLLDRNGDLVALVDVITQGPTYAPGEESGEFSFSFPQNSQLVIRTSAIRALEERLAGPVLTDLKQSADAIANGSSDSRPQAEKPLSVRGDAMAAPDTEIDPADLPDELSAANIAFRAVTKGHGDPATPFKNRLIDYLGNNYRGLKNTAVQRIATVANPDKAPGRKKRNAE